MAFAMDYDDPFVTSLVHFVAGAEFQGIFERFFVLHALEFSDAEEHDLKYHSLYLQFQEMFEAKLNEFAEAHDIVPGEFVGRLKQAQLADAKAAHYIKILLASAEYETFVALMRMMRPVAEARQEEQQDKSEHQHFKHTGTSARIESRADKLQPDDVQPPSNRKRSSDPADGKDYTESDIDDYKSHKK